MTISLLFGKKYSQTRVGGIFLDAVISEDHNYNSRVTNYPIEDGTFVSDHIINEPERLEIEGIVSDTPINIFSFFNRSIDSFNRLVRINQTKQVITVVTGIKVYTDMVITSLIVPRTFQSGQSLRFNIQLQKLKLDSSVRFITPLNEPFNKNLDVIPRAIVAENTNIPIIMSDPPQSLKDQASSGIDAGIQNLRNIEFDILPNILDQVRIIKGEI